ncbi:methyl-accepting chemotaxis protein [Enterobacter cloacae]|uniref:Methyl-accepting chemotaxis protein n=1 Tax=Enterobacter cloacae subsp. cloacae (strain ATCC 13047 / DSM 30054 / NBRC 13535 / NCTC 10005 / WDCM 00083 / NCDC 279-56) TaxID=716541 RepID=A0A0H3CMH0_ENTCC|nr:methyl-accepting chemotaxis protein [Enterobacter cloacae]ADF62819.1 methyl-accepting chemotaxis protein [Enterobacter cloacae subsp. cloacae ATCC 13047]ELD6622265.1 methyl-accepting chemotaxis protein [Enterobacter cloacae]KGB11489.1 putative methyl-accepting chemotaxis protein [Enterobacter cloacae]MBW4207233.1 methyl-accepting chemotaxis protein [Enterobacter cloacae subsp. cloacae]MBW4227776.1 methyl-accepting chemotaxis protein [Enterobacter cloacae subsp. cloacae]
MVFIVILVVIFITLVILVQAGVMPWFIRTEGQRLRTQVDALATQLREQLDRVEAQQRSMTESVVTLKSFALDKGAPGDTDIAEETGTSRQFFNSLVKEIGERLGGRAWMVDDTGRIIGDAAGAPTVQSLNDASLPMAVPLRGLLAQPGEGLRHTRFRSASGEHTLVVTPIAETPWLLAIDVPTRRLGERPGILLHKPWPLAALLLVSTLTLLRSVNLHLSRLNEELPSQLKTEQGAHLPPLMQEIGEQVRVIAQAASTIAEENERLLRVPEANGNLLAMLSESTTGVVQAMNALHDAALQIADSSGALVQLASRAYSYSLHNEEGIFAVESRNLASRCARSSKELRALVDDAMMQAQSGAPSVTQNNSVLIEEVYTVANALLQRTGS